MTDLHKISYSKLSLRTWFASPLEVVFFFLLKDTFHGVGEGEFLFC